MLVATKDLSKADLQIAFLRQEVGAQHALLTCTQVVQIMKCFHVSVG